MNAIQNKRSGIRPGIVAIATGLIVALPLSVARADDDDDWEDRWEDYQEELEDRREEERERWEEWNEDREEALEDWRLGGFEIVDDAPDAVVVSYDHTLTFDRLARTAYWLSRGVPYFATHPDRICPTDQPTVLPD